MINLPEQLEARSEVCFKMFHQPSVVSGVSTGELGITEGSSLKANFLTSDTMLDKTKRDPCKFSKL